MPQTVTVQLHPGSTMDRTVPALIHSIVSAEEWTGFCEQIDGVVQPYQKRMRRSVVGTFAGFLLGGIILMVSFMAMGNASFECFPNCDGPQINPGVIIGPILILGSFFGGIYTTVNGGSRIESKIKSECEKFSKNYPLLSVHYKTNTTTSHEHHFGEETRRRYHTDYFLEILVADEPPREDVPVTYAMEVPMANVMAVEVPFGSTDGKGALKTISNDRKERDSNSNDRMSVPMGSTTITDPSATITTPAERMEQLEQMRGMLTEEEYYTKRTEILDSV